jgi:uncharacterized membrane protein
VEVYSDEFTVPDNYSMEDIKHRVRSWLASPSGTDYVMEVVSERHVILTKSKHDLKICCYGCIAMIASIFLLVFIMIGISFPMYSYAALMNAMMGYVAVIGVIMAITIAVFCLKPEKAVFEMRFGNEIPIQVYIHRSGEVDKSAYEYTALKDAIQGGYSQHDGPAPTY